MDNLSVPLPQKTLCDKVMNCLSVINEGLSIYKSSLAGHSLTRVTHTQSERERESEGSGAREGQRSAPLQH